MMEERYFNKTVEEKDLKPCEELIHAVMGEQCSWLVIIKGSDRSI